MTGQPKKDRLAEDSVEQIGQLDSWARGRGFSQIVGVDEVGRGPLAGPVVAAAMILPADHGISGLADSKRLSARQRQRLAAILCDRSQGWGFGLVGPRRIDMVNIRIASLEAMSQALQQVLDLGITPDLILVDGRDRFSLPDGAPPIIQKAVIKADTRSESVAAASILAKVYRDALMREYHSFWPQYGFDRHKGYPTREHKLALRAYGHCPIHRLSFRGVL